MHLDTHVVLWLHEGATDRLPDPVLRRIDAEPIQVSPAVALELSFLHELTKIASSAASILDHLATTIGLTISPTPFLEVARAAATLTWTRDPFDRLICAHAIADETTLLTYDRVIHRHLERAIWDDEP